MTRRPAGHGSGDDERHGAREPEAERLRQAQPSPLPHDDDNRRHDREQRP
jgi:hypothetical protein